MKTHKANRSFRFRQFEVFHDRCAMKVGTDGVLLGAWADVTSHTRILDVGCGSGLVALMIAQRAPHATIIGIDIEQASVEQARENVAISPFSKQITCLMANVLTYAPQHLFDHVVSNPPFFEEDTLPPDQARMHARNTAALPLPKLLSSVAHLLTPEGSFSLILPTVTAHRFITLALSEGWRVARTCTVWSTEHKPPRRMLLTITKGKVMQVMQESLILNNSDGTRTEAYQQLCKEYYL